MVSQIKTINHVNYYKLLLPYGAPKCRGPRGSCPGCPIGSYATVSYCKLSRPACIPNIILIKVNRNHWRKWVIRLLYKYGQLLNLSDSTASKDMGRTLWENFPSCRTDTRYMVRF